MFRILVTLLIAACIFACGPKDEPVQDTKAIVGATLIGTQSGDVITDGVLVVQGNIIVSVGSKDQVQIPAGAEVIEVTGKYIMPGMINAHGHIGDVEGMESGRYSKANVIRDLKLNAQYGVTAVNSLGGDQQASIDIRNEADSINNYSRLFAAGAVVVGNTPEEAIKVVDQNAAMNVDFIKIRVDDNLGTAEKMKPEVYEAVIARAEALNIPVAAHIFYLEDAKAMLRLGVKFIAHSVRDKAVDEEFVQMMLDNDAYYCPTLMREVSTFVYEETPAFFNDPYFLKAADTVLLNQLKDPERQQRMKESKTAQGYKRALEIAMQNLKILSDRGVNIAMGTDAGPVARFQGYFEHEELAMMVDAGMTPAQVIESATATASASINQPKLGALAEGNYADFLILDSNPLDNIRNMRSIESVWIGGYRLEQ